MPDDYKLLTPDEIAQINHAPHLSSYMPKQEAGIKPSCSLPYELYAHGRLTTDKRSFEINLTAGNELHGASAAGSPFNVYAPGKYLQEDVRTWAYAVKAGDSVTDSWPLNEFENEQYYLRVYGSNGFFREFKGNAAAPRIEAACEYDTKAADHFGLNIIVENFSGKDHRVEIIDNAYNNKPISRLLAGAERSTGIFIMLNKSFGWYDFSVRIPGNGTYERRFAGRVETGRPSYTDPHMGNIQV